MPDDPWGQPIPHFLELLRSLSVPVAFVVAFYSAVFHGDEEGPGEVLICDYSGTLVIAQN
jgi:hypothetical protein